MSFSISNIVNKFINVRNKVKTVDGEWVDQVKPKETQYMQDGLGVSISSETIIEVFEVWDKKVIIDTIEFGTDTSAYARLHVRDDATGNYENQVFHEVNPGGGRANATPAVISRGSKFFDVVREDGNSKVWLKDRVVLPEGGRLSFGSVSDGAITYKVLWRVVDD